MFSASQPGGPRLARLRAFDAVATAGAMGAAAERLHLTQPAITRALQSLERELGVRLLTRRTSGSFLTEQGAMFARRTRRCFVQMNGALQEAAAADGAAAARLARKISDVHMRCLMAIGAERSFRAAARALGVAEPTLHRPARELERLVRTPLYRRTSDGIGLSPKGAELARRFSLCMTEVAAGVAELSSQRGAAQATIVVGVLPLAPKRLLATAAEPVLQAYPNARLAIREGAYDELLPGLRSGTIDMIFGALRAPPPFTDLGEEKLFEDPYRVVCRHGHPLLRLARATVADLKAYDWVFATSDLPRRAVLDGIIGRSKLSARAQIETNSVGALFSVLSGSDRISLLPRAFVTLDNQSDALAVLDLRVAHRLRVVGLTVRRDWLPTALQTEFLSLLREVARKRDEPRRDR